MKKILKKIIGKILPEYIIKKSSYWDSQYYEKTYNISSKKAAKHFLKNGYKQGYNPSTIFSCDEYRKRYSDTERMNPLLHYELYGMYENRFCIEDSLFELNQNTEYMYNINNIEYKFCNVNIKSMLDVFYALGANVYFKNRNSDGKYVAVFSHQMTLTGAPVALNEMIKKIKKLGYNPIVFCNLDGPMTSELIKNDIDFIIYNKIAKDDVIEQYLELFSFVIVNTCSLETIDLINKFNGKDIQVLWWVHEGYEIFNCALLEKMPKNLFNNIHVYCVGDYAKKALQKFRKNYNIETLLYDLPIITNNSNLEENLINTPKDKIVFAIVGTLEKRKGHDVLLDAIRKMDKELRKKSFFYIVGSKCDNYIYKKIKIFENQYPQNIKYLGVIPRNRMDEFYSKIDCLICCSTDDPMPIVVTEAWQRKIFTICSNNTGQASIIKKEECGLIYTDNNPNKLLEKIKVFVNNEIDINSCINKARKIFEENFTEKIFENNINNIINKLTEEKNFDGLISIIIPVYNGGQDIKKLLESLKNQKNINYEIICIDSGSTDNSIETIKKYNCKLIEILNEDFSHSYARNLGADNAKGEYLLFMTQDALPNDENWLKKFMNLAISSNVDAATCMQRYKEEHNLYGKFEVWNHMNWLQMDRNNKIITWKDEYKDFNKIRPNASLSDVVCLIKHEVFNKFKYRGSFGEDLDMGIRLLKSGYKLGLYSSVSIKHSHNRSQFYNFKRGIIDEEFLKHVQKINDYKVIQTEYNNSDSKILSIYKFCICLINNMYNSKELIYDINTYYKFVYRNINKSLNINSFISKDEEYNIFMIKPSYVDKEIYNFIIELYKEKRNDYKFKISYLYPIINILNNDLKKFLKINNTILKDVDIKEQIINVILNRMAIIIGVNVAEENENNPNVSNILKKMKKNIIEKSGI